jgi:hypothetical protein
VYSFLTVSTGGISYKTLGLTPQHHTVRGMVFFIFQTMKKEANIKV